MPNAGFSKKKEKKERKKKDLKSEREQLFDIKRKLHDVHFSRMIFFSPAFPAFLSLLFSFVRLFFFIFLLIRRNYQSPFKI